MINAKPFMLFWVMNKWDVDYLQKGIKRYQDQMRTTATMIQYNPKDQDKVEKLAAAANLKAEARPNILEGCLFIG